MAIPLRASTIAVKSQLSLVRRDRAAVINDALAQAGQLATLPEIALEVMRLAEDPHANGEALNHVLSRDPTLCARVLKIVNSAYYGMRREVTSIDTAVVVMGFGAVKSIAVAASLARMFRAGKLDGGFDARELWTHSIAVAVASRLIAERVKSVEPNDAFLAGLIHDLGLIVEVQGCRPEFAAVIAAAAADPCCSFRQLEERIIGADHEAFGEALCQKWRFPPELSRVSGYHHRPLELPVSERRLTAIVHVADHLAAASATGFARTVEAGAIDAGLLAWLGLTDVALVEIVAQLPGAVEEVTPLLAGTATH